MKLLEANALSAVSPVKSCASTVVEAPAPMRSCFCGLFFTNTYLRTVRAWYRAERLR